MPTTTLVDQSFKGASQNIPGNVPGVAGAAGVSSGGVTSTASMTESKGSNLLGIPHEKFNYTLVVKVPTPFAVLNLDLKMLGKFVLAKLSPLRVPQAQAWLLKNATKYFNLIVEDAVDLIRAVPEATVTVQVLVGTVAVINVLLIAEDTPVEIVPPTFQLGLPNLAVDLNILPPMLPFPPIIVRVPIPVPIIQPVKLLGISGGNINATAGAHGGQAGPGTAGPGSLAVSGQPGSGTFIPGAIATPIVKPRI